MRYKAYFENKDDARNNEIERLQNMENITRLQSLQSFGVDYQAVEVPDGALIYCDIPYNSTNCGKYQGFDHQRFYEWARTKDNIFISEYGMPDDFIPYAWTEKQVLSAASGNNITAKEMIYTNQRTYDRLSKVDKMRVSLNFSEQMSLF